MSKLRIKRITHGKKKGEFRFNLIGDNGEVISVSETYTQKHNIIELRDRYFREFEIEDLSIINKNKK